jgi:hypothetical protein
MCKMGVLSNTEDNMFTRSNGRFMQGQPNYNIRDKRDRHGQVVVEKQSRSHWGTRLGKWDRDTNKSNHKKARHHAKNRQ